MNRSDLLSLAAIVVSMLSVIATVFGAAAAINANYIATQANALAMASKSESSANSEADRQLQRSIAEMQQLAKRPALQLLRFSQLTERECYATVQNTGERYVAMFDVVCQDSDHGMRGSLPGTVAIIPNANSSDVVKISFENTQQRTHSFQPPVKVAPGEILTFKLSVSPDFSSGDFALFFNENDHIQLGQLTARTEVDPFSLFGSFQPPGREQ